MLGSLSKSLAARLTCQTAAAALLAMGMAGAAYAETVTGTLADGDATTDAGGYSDRYEFEVTSAGMLYVDLVSDDFDTYLTLVTPSGELLENDDYGMSFNSRVMFNTEETGTFIAIVSSYDTDGAGEYTLVYNTIELNEGGPAATIAADGETISGELAMGDGFNEHGSFFDTYEVEIEEGAHIFFSVSSDEFDTLIALISPSGEEYVNDDYGMGVNSGLMMQAEESGTYEFVVTSYGEGATGAYELDYQVSDAPFGGMPEVLVYTNDVVEGELSEDDGMMPNGSVVDLYEISLQQGTSMMVRLDSDDFDTVLTITSPSGEEMFNDDFGDSLNSGLMILAEETGIYTIEVGAFGMDGLGAYTMDYRTSDEPFSGAPETLEPGSGEIYGRLELGDGVHLSGALQDVYQLEVAEGETLILRLNSEQFDPFLRVTTPQGYDIENDDFAGELNSAIMTVAETAGTYTIVATSYGAGEAGDYAFSYQVSDEIEAGPATSLSRDGGDVEGMLTLGDGINEDGTLYDFYEIELVEGETFQLFQRSDAFDSYLTVATPSGEEFVNDDFGGGFDSRVAFEAPESGVYTVTASTFGSGEAGSYTISYAVSDEPIGGPPVELNGDEGSLEAELSITDATGENGSYMDEYTLDVPAGALLTADMNSIDFDTFLMVRGPDGSETFNDDFEGSLSHSRVELTAFAGGEYTITASAYSAGEYGDYELSFMIDEDNPRDFFTGELAEGDDLAEEGQYQDSYEIEAEVGQDLVVDLRSAEFDTYLTVIAPDGETLENDDYTGLGHSHVEQRVRVPGTYTVLVRSFGEGETGSYTVEYSQEEGPVMGGELEAEAEIGSGDSINGVLEDGDALHEAGEFRDVYSFEAGVGEEVAFDLFSAGFDTYLIVVSPDGTWTENDDYNGSLDHSHITMTTDQAGEYMVIVTSYDPEETGDYLLFRRS